MKLKKLMQLMKLNSGQALMEVILATAIFGLIAVTLIAMTVGSLRGIQQGGEQSEAQSLALEGIEAVRSIRDRAWNENTFSTSSISVAGGLWRFGAEGSTETIGKFTRTVSFQDVCRDNGTDDIVTCGTADSYTDVQSKEVLVIITWITGVGATNTIERRAYMTNWDSSDWSEDTSADLDDGTFSNTATSTTLGDGDGVVILDET